MAAKDLSPIEKSASTQPSSLAGGFKQTTKTGDPPQDGNSRRAYPTHPEQEVSSVLFMELLAERAGATTQVLREIQERRCDVYGHGGIND
jgi:hypothetical protein